MAPMIVKRICRRKNALHGPFRASVTQEFSHYLDANHMPGTYHDRLKFSNSLIEPLDDRYKVYGVHAPGALRYFTSMDRDLLRKCGFVVRTYMVPPGTFVRGTEQVNFYLPTAIPVGVARL